MGVDLGENWFEWELWVYQKKSKNKQFFTDRVRNDSGLGMIGSRYQQLYSKDADGVLVLNRGIKIFAKSYHIKLILHKKRQEIN